MKPQTQLSRGLIPFLTLQLALPIISTDIYLPSLKAISNFFHTNLSQAQLTLTIYFFTFGIVQLIYGPLSDKFGRKPILLLSLSIYTIATLFCIFAATIKMLIVGRCLQALGAGSAILTFAIIRDLYEGEQAAKKIAYMSAVVAISPVIAPIIGGYIQSSLSWQWNFAILFIIAVVLLILCYWLLPETNKSQSSSTFFKRILRDYQSLLVNRNYMSHSLSAAFAFGALFAYVSGAPYVLMNLMGYSSQRFGWIFATAAIGYVFGALFNGRLVAQYGMDAMGRIGIISLVSGAIIMTLLCFCFPSAAFAVVIPQILCEFGISIVVSINISKALQPIPHYAGAGSSLLGFLRFTAAALASCLVMVFRSTTSLPLAFTILGFSLFSLGFSRLGLVKNTKIILAK